MKAVHFLRCSDTEALAAHQLGKAGSNACLRRLNPDLP